MPQGSLTLKRGGNALRVTEKDNKELPIITSGNQRSWDLSNEDQYREWLRVYDKLFVEGGAATTTTLTLEYCIDSYRVSAEANYTFIAATCGTNPPHNTQHGQPLPEQRVRFESWFPSLVHCEWSILNEATGPPRPPAPPGMPDPDTYNCIAWTVDDTSHWYDKVSSIPLLDVIGIDEVYGNPRNGVFELSDLDKMYSDKKGYTPSASGPADTQVMYYSGFHGAKKRSCTCGAGTWIVYSSKCGEGELIEHVWNQLNSPWYGSPVRFYK